MTMPSSKVLSFDPGRLAQQLKFETIANRYAKIRQDNGKRLINKIVNK
jgi:hypothetical protein